VITVGGFLVTVLAAIVIPVVLSAREDVGAQYADLDCYGAARDAVRFAEDIAPPGEPLLVDVAESELLLDHRDELVEPQEGGYEVILTCRGQGVWEDGTSGPVFVDLLLEHPDVVLVSYRPGF